MRFLCWSGKFRAIASWTVIVHFLLMFSGCGGGGTGISEATLDTGTGEIPGPTDSGFNYYVSASNGNDANPGTSDFPFKTVSCALERAMPGDRIGIRAGTYREELLFPRGGTGSSHAISLEAVPGADVRIKGSDVVTGWESHSGAIWKKTGWQVNSQQVFVDGLPLQQIGAGSPFHALAFGVTPILPSVGSGISDMTAGSFWYDAGAKCLYIRTKDDSSPLDHTVEASVRKWVIPHDERLNYIVLRGLSFSHSNLTSEALSLGIVNVAGRSWTISSNTFEYGDFAGISVTGAGHRIESNVFRNNGNIGILVNGSDASHGYQPYQGSPPQQILFDGNTATGNNYRDFAPEWQAGGMKGVGCNDVQVIGQKALDNGGPGIWFDGGSRNIVVDGSEASRNKGAGIAVEISDNSVISDSIADANTYYGIMVSASDNVSVLRNRVSGNKAGIVLHGMPRAEHPTLKNNHVGNNLISGNELLDLVIFHDPVLATGNTSDYNSYVRETGKVSIAWTTTESYFPNYTDLAIFARETGLDSHSTSSTR